ncbi:MAG: hypothetical protein R3C16_12835 [Hyphomonadaceae bacterium]
MALVPLRTGAGVDLGHGAPYLLFVLTGVCSWFIFADMVPAASTRARGAMRGLIQKVYFPILDPAAGASVRASGDRRSGLIAIVALQITMGVGADWKRRCWRWSCRRSSAAGAGHWLRRRGSVAGAAGCARGPNIALYLGLFLSPVFAPSVPGRPCGSAWQSAGRFARRRARRTVRDGRLPRSVAHSCVFTVLTLLVGLTLLGRASRNGGTSAADLQPATQSSGARRAPLPAIRVEGLGKRYLLDGGIQHGCAAERAREGRSSLLGLARYQSQWPMANVSALSAAMARANRHC